MGVPDLSATTMGQDRAGVRAAISRAASRTGVDFNYLVAQAKSESGLNPAARAGNSSATGLYQFIDQSWLAVVKTHGSKHGMDWAADAIRARRGGGWTVDPQLRPSVFALREQPEASALMAAEYASDNASGISRALGRAATATDLYMAHFLGLDRAIRFLKAAQASPDAAAAPLFPREAAANRSIFYARNGAARSLDQVYRLMAGKLEAQGKEPAPGPLRSRDPLRLDYAGEVFTSEAAEQAGPVEIAALLGGVARFDPLRPGPATARLAYLMLASDEIVTGGEPSSRNA